jgi:hypothetical protein
MPDPRLDDADPPFSEPLPTLLESTGPSFPVLELPHATASHIAVHSGTP